MRKFIFFVLLACVLCTVRGQAIYDYRYWFDNNDSDQMTGTLTSEKWNIDVDLSGLDNALHSIHIQVKDTSDIWSPAVTRWFLKTPTAEELYKVTCVCMIDGVPFREEMLTSESGVVNWDLDVSSISQGVHFFQVQIFDSNGFLSNTYEDYFYRSITDAELENVKVLYRVDDGEFKELSNSVGAGVYHFDIDVSSLDNGVHRLTCMFTSESGLSTKVSNSFFLKLPVGGSGVKAYRYWLNADGTVSHVELPDRPSVYELVSLLPVESCPIRSSCFHFEIADDGSPMIYAKNDMHILFYDAFDRSTEAHKQYVDYNVGEVIEEITLLESGKRVYKAKPQDNKIYWFKAEAVAGDSLSIKTDQACTLQIFSPSGKEMYCASGSETVSFDGCHADEDGAYYIALHDVTGTRGNTIALDFQHIDKYDVLRWDVSTVGNGGCSTITFEGNGFKDLYAVDFYNNNGDTIDSKVIHYESDAIVKITFNFTDKNTGKYNAVFHFTTEDRNFSNMITVEDAKTVKLELDVRYPATFLRGTTTTYSITVTNKGNATAYNVPMEIYLRSGKAFSDISSVEIEDEFGNNDNILFKNVVDKDSIDKETLFYIENLLNSLDDSHLFLICKDSIEGEFGYTDRLLTIPPYGSVKFEIKIKSDYSVDLFAKIPTEWMTVYTREDIRVLSRSNPFERDWCCEKEKWECTVNIIANVVGMIPVAGCISGLADMAFYTTFEIACANGNTLGEKELEFYNSVANDPSTKASVVERSISGLIGCVSGAIGKAIEKLVKKLNQINKARSAAIESSKIAFQQQHEAIQSYRYLNKKADDAFNAGDYESYKLFRNSASEALANSEKYASEANNYVNEAKRLLAEAENLNKQIDAEKAKLAEIIDQIKNGVSAIVSGPQCVQAWKQAKKNCPPDPPGGGSSNPVNSFDPNDIYGYRSEAGSKAVKKDWTDVYYTIEFENDTAFATASAQDVYLTDTLDSRYFDLESFAPTSLKIGDKKVELSGEPNFVTTVDMRPKINAIAQVECQYDEQRGIAKWHFTSLDPMTMEHVTVPMDGFLPVNNSEGDGQGEVSFNVRLKTGLADGEQIPNRASIVFDLNEAIMTPTWVNVVDTIAPQSAVVETAMKNDSIMTIFFDGTDNYSGVWKYDLYVQAGVGASWFKLAENLTDSLYDYRVYEGIDYGFCVIATDSAGNVEQKELVREGVVIDYVMGDVNGDDRISIVDITMVTNAILKKEDEGFNAKAADLNEDGRVSIVDATMITNLILKK